MSARIEKFSIRSESGAEVGYQADHDLCVKIDSTLRHAEGGYVLIRLNLDGDGFDEIHVDPPAGRGRTGEVEVLREVIDKLIELDHAFTKMESALD